MAYFRREVIRMALDRLATLALAALLAWMPIQPAYAAESDQASDSPEQKLVIYQAFTRLFGNKQTVNIPWGTLQQNGVGKFADFDDKALQGIKQLGVSHIWYTGVPHHALVGDYTAYGISIDDPDVIKGRAGSPYAVKDYYSVNPDLALDPARRLEEFRALIERSHKHGLKVMIDIVPNHVARAYRSHGAPAGSRDFGADDDTSVEYAVDNDFYYVPGQPFEVPVWPANYQVLGGNSSPMLDGKFAENPAKWTGNGARAAQPKFDDWYETVKINYGVRPDGTFDFPRLPADYAGKDWQAHYAFWQGKKVPSSWEKFRDITQFWLAQGVDGFRYDMAEMVPVEFWSYLNSQIKHTDPEAILLAEVYNPKLYRDYVGLGKMDYLYDKVDFYDQMKAVMQGKSDTAPLLETQAKFADIEHHLLHFLENHDEQRIASPEFAGDARKGMPAMTVSATIGTSPTLLYFGQDVGEKGEGHAGFGKASRTTIFDYRGVPAHQRWMNDGAFDGGRLTPDEKQLRAYYTTLMQFTRNAPALMGRYRELHTLNLDTAGYDGKVLAFARWSEDQQLLVVSNFSADASKSFDLKLSSLIADWGLGQGTYEFRDVFTGAAHTVTVSNKSAITRLDMAPLQSVILVRNP
jgi:glycosidase